MDKDIVWLTIFSKLWKEGLDKFFEFLTGYEYEREIDRIIINYDNIRPAGEPLKTFGGYASGHESLKRMFEKIDKLLKDKKKSKVKLKPIDAMDIANIIAENVVSGGVRRSSQICLFDEDDEEIANAKSDLYKVVDGKWIKDESISHRQMSNNTMMYEEKPSREQLSEHLDNIRYSGEPGFLNVEEAKRRRDNFKGVNPCAEILLDSKGVCNLTSVNVMGFVEDGSLDREGLFKAQRLSARAAYRMTLLDFEFPEWDRINKRDRLVGLSLTGWQDMVNALGWNELDNDKRKQKALLQELKNIGQNAVEEYANQLGKKIPKLVTSVKPEGCITKDHSRVTDQGILYIDELDSNIDSYEENKFEELEGYTKDDNNISSVYNNGKDDIIRLTLKNGRKLDLTYNHPLSVNDEWKEAKDIEIDDIIDFKLGNYDKETHSILEDIDTNEFRKGSNGMNNYNTPNKMTEDLAWLIGAYLANGSFPIDKDRKYQHRIKFHCEHYDVHKKVQRIWKELFNLDTRIIKSSDRNSYTQDFGSVKIRKWFKKNNIDKVSNTKLDRIPKIIRTSSKKDIISFIVGYADNDGCFSRGSFSIDSINKGLIRQFQEIGEAVGISFSYIENTERDGYSDNTMYKNHMSRVYTKKEVIDYINEISVKAKNNPLKNSNGYKYIQNPYKVVSKEKIEDKKTYGVQVDNEHWYYQGGLKSHNTQTQMPTVSSGLHYNHSPYYIRRVRMSETDPLVNVLEDLNYTVEDVKGNPGTVVAEFPVKAPSGKVKDDVSAIEQLEVYKMFMENYVDHNASITVHVRDDEWDDVEEWLWNNWDSVVAVSFISYDDNFYDQMPYEEITEEEYQEMVDKIDGFKPSLVNKYEKKKHDREIEESSCETGACPIR